LPIGAEEAFVGVVDLVTMTALLWDKGTGIEFRTEAVPAGMLAAAEAARHALIEAVAETSDELMEAYFESGELTESQIRFGMRTGVILGKLVPVLCGSAFKNKGVQPLLDAVIDYLPSPADIPAVTGETPAGDPVVRHPDDDEPFAGVMFKVQTDPFVGRLSYVRVYSGRLATGDSVLTPPRAARTGWVASCACTPTPERTSPRSVPATSSPSSA